MTYRAITAAAALSIGLLSVALPQPARADVEYPWCGYFPMFQGFQQSCSFNTLEQCRAFVSPSGYCDTNPRGSLARTPMTQTPAYPVRRR